MSLDKEPPAPAPGATKPCLIEGKCKHGNWCSEVYCQEHCKFVKEAAPAQAQQSKGDPKLLAILNAPMTLQEAYGEGWCDRKQFKNFDEAWQQSTARYKAEAKPEAQQPKGLTTERLRQMHHEDEFGLFCDFDEFEQIARAVEQEHSIGASGEASNG